MKPLMKKKCTEGNTTPRVFQHTWLKQYVWPEYRKQEGVAGGGGDDDAAEADDGNMRMEYCWSKDQEAHLHRRSARPGCGGG